LSKADDPSPDHAYGSIVLVADMLDPHGRNPKDRPCVIVTDPEAIPEGRQLVVAISTVLPAILPDDYVLLPWQRPYHPKTGLNKRNAAIRAMGRGHRRLADHPEGGGRAGQAAPGASRGTRTALPAPTQG
jgi:hypothetical protein